MRKVFYSLELLTWILLAPFCGFSEAIGLEGKWYIELQHTDIGLVRTTLYFETTEGSFEAFTRKNADKAILGGFTATVARAFGNFKGGSLLRVVNGVYDIGKDTIKWKGILTSAMGNYYIDGYVVGQDMHGRIRNGNLEEVGRVTGQKKEVPVPMENYTALFEESLVLTKDKIFNPQLLQTSEWTTFEKDMRKTTPKLMDDLEMVFAFFYNAGKLPISHYALMKLPERGLPENRAGKKTVELREENTGTAYLKVNSFDGTAHEMDSIFVLIKTKGYAHLIVDLRNNPGGSVEAGMAFATNLIDSNFFSGIFLTQKYFHQNRELPTLVEYQNFPHFSEANFDLILEGIHQHEGLCLKVVPQPNTYQGKLYILTNQYTGSTCEPIVYSLKQVGRAVVVGEKTAGRMLNGEIFELNKGFQLIVPTADYYTSDGFRIDQNGVEPTIKVKQDDALEYVLGTLIPGR